MELAVVGASSSSPSWAADLLPELLVQVLLRMPSYGDRVRFRAVCRSWRSAVQPSDLPPLLPWIALRNGTFLSVPDGGVLYQLSSSPGPGAHVSRRVSMGDTLFHVHRDITCSVTNPLTGETTGIDPAILCYDKDIWTGVVTNNVRKVVVSDRVVATISISGVASIFSRGAPRTGSACCLKCKVSGANDMVLFQGKLYLLTSQHSIPVRLHHKLHAMELDQANNMHPQCVIPGTPDIYIPVPGTPANTWPRDVYKRYYYLLVSGDRLLMVEREVEMERLRSIPNRTRRLEVFEATGLLRDDRSGGHARGWRKLDTLMGHALFVSLGCSWSVPVANHYGRTIGGPQEDCVYFMNEHTLHPRTDTKPEDDFRNCGVYNVRDQTMSPLPVEMAPILASHGGPWSLTWFFLPHTRSSS